MARLDGKVGLITGGAAGIGYATAEAFLSEGAKVVITDIDQDALTRAADSLGEPDRLATVRADVSSAADWETAVSTAEDRFGGLDVLVNNAGIEVLGTAETVDEATWNRIMAINVTGAYLGVRAALPLLRRSRGTIINMASIAGLIGAPGWVAYITSKHALVGMTKAMALDYAQDGIRVNAICPGMVQTPMAERIVRVVGQGDAAAGREALVAGVPLGRFIEPAEVGDIVVHLASDEARFTAGLLYVIDGGATVGIH